MTSNSAVAAMAVAALMFCAMPGAAEAGIWAWGCVSKPEAGQVVFSRFSLLRFNDKPTHRSLTEIATSTAPLADATSTASFQPADNPVDSGDAFQKLMPFVAVGDPGQKLVLTEKSSRKISTRKRMIAYRDEIRTAWKKVYHLTRDGEPSRDIAMDCMEYMLSTEGGRKPLDD
ncbi:hypothetical protein BH11PSE4_BH11PSE4_34530 [soil metagenome]